MHENDFKIYLLRYRQVINKIGIGNLMKLPKYYKEKLKNTTDLVDKVLLLEEIAMVYY